MELRKKIDGCLRTDADLEGFCIDYFPEIQARFSASMERKQKVNLLLQLAECEKLYALLDKLDYPSPSVSRKLAIGLSNVSTFPDGRTQITGNLAMYLDSIHARLINKQDVLCTELMLIITAQVNKYNRIG